MSDIINQIESLPYAEGISALGRMSSLHPTQNQHQEYVTRIYTHIPSDVTAEIYRGPLADGIKRIGMIAARHIDPNVDTELQFADVASMAGARYTELAQAEHVFGSTSPLSNLAEMLGLSYVAQETDKAKTFGALMLDGPETINERLVELGITDRKFASFAAGTFDGETMLTALAKPVPEMLLAEDNWEAVHDRAFHLVGQVLIAPEVLTRISERSRRLLINFKHAEAVIGGRPFYEFDGDEPARYFDAMNALSKFVGSLDYDIPVSSFQIANAMADGDDWQIKYHLKELKIAEDHELPALAGATIHWAQHLCKTAAEHAPKPSH